MDGGGIAVSGSKVVTAWRRDREIFVATPGEKETAVGEGMDVGITQSGHVVWSTPQGIQVLAPGQRAALTLSPRGKFPSIVSAHRTLVAWEDDGKIVVQAVPAGME